MPFTCQSFCHLRKIVPFHQEFLVGYKMLNQRLLHFLWLFYRNVLSPTLRNRWIAHNYVQFSALQFIAYILKIKVCLEVLFIPLQADYIGRNILSKLLYDWRLLDELGVLRAIYLLGSGIL